MYISTLVRKVFCLGLFISSLGAAAQTPFKPVKLEVKNERAINSAALEFSPSFYEDGIVFVSSNSMGTDKIRDRHIELPTMTILRARRDSSGMLRPPTLFAKELTSRYHEGPVSFDKTTDEVFFTRNILLDGKEKYAKDGEQKSRIYTATRLAGTWGEPFALPFNDNEFDDYHPSINIDGDVLYFSSDRPGGMGGMDLYVSHKKNNVWSEPVNLGPNVNTAGNEVFPFIHADNTLYFASNGHNGAGGLDLFYTFKEAAAWAKPLNLGGPFNTNGDDFGLIVDLNKINGYFSSNGTANGLGKDDILSFHTTNGNLDDYLGQKSRMPAADPNLIVDVVSKETNAPLPNSTVRIFSLAQNKILGRDSLGNLITLQNVNGEYVMKVAQPDNGINGVTNKVGRFSSDTKPDTYVIIVSQDGYQTRQIIREVNKDHHQFVVPLEQAKGVHWNTVLLDERTNEPLAGTMVVLTNPKTGQKDTINTDGNGMVDYYLNADTDYNVDIYRNGQIISSTKINPEKLEKGKPSVIDVAESTLIPGAIIELPNIYYNFNDASLRPEASQDLSAVFLLLRQYPRLRVELGSHTDCRGTDAYNDALSSNRAASVVDYLIGQGIAANRLEHKGYGETKLKNHCADNVNCAEKEHARNRRTEIRILSGAEGVTVKYVEGSLGLGPSGPGLTTTQRDYLPTVTKAMTYAVVVGSYRIENGAQSHLSQVRNAGYPEAEVKQFDNSPYFSVVAKQCNTMEEARIMTRKMAAKDQMAAFIVPNKK